LRIFKVAMNLLDNISLKNALLSLERAIAEPLNEFSRDSVILRFKFTFELSWKLLRRYMESDCPLTDDSVKGIFREAHQRFSDDCLSSKGL